MNILLTVLELSSYSGLPLYTRDLAIELKRLGHAPEIYAIAKGRLAEELQDAAIPVTDNPARIRPRPDIIHGQIRVPTYLAVKQCRSSPALFICHNHTFWGDQAPVHPRILLYLGVSRVCIERLEHDGIPASRIAFSPNFVDTNRFLPRPPLPATPRRALVFSNYASEESQLPAIREACRRMNLHLDVVGGQAGVATQPEVLLKDYDIVFAKAKAAMEAMATGAAVILCDFAGAGPMVTLQEFDSLRLMNFGFQALTKPLEPGALIAEIARYDPEDTARVRDKIRAVANLQDAARNMVLRYESVINEYKSPQSKRTSPWMRLSMRDSFYWERAKFWAALEPARNPALVRVLDWDPAAREHLHLFTREVAIPKPQSLLARSIQKVLAMVQQLFSRSGQYLRAWFVRMWMTIPVRLRVRIKRAPLVKAVLDRLKRMLAIT
jgi:hypothetical protein